MKNGMIGNNNKKKSNTKLFHLGGLDENNHALRYRSHSCLIPSLTDLAYCLEFVPKLK